LSVGLWAEFRGAFDLADLIISGQDRLFPSMEMTADVQSGNISLMKRLLQSFRLKDSSASLTCSSPETRNVRVVDVSLKQKCLLLDI